MYRLHAYMQSLRGRVISRFIAVACGWHVLYRNNSDGIYRRKSYDVFPSVRCKLYRHVIIFIYSRSRVQISFQIFTDLCPVALVVVLTIALLDCAYRLHCYRTITRENECRSRNRLVWN